MGQFLDSAVFASGTGSGGGGGIQTPTDGKKPTIPATGGGVSPVTTSPMSSVVSAFSSGGTRVCLVVFHYLFDLLCHLDP